MENLRWRISARVAACVQLVLCSLFEPLIVTVGLHEFPAEADVLEHHLLPLPLFMKGTVEIRWLVVLIASILVIATLSCTIIFLEATEPNQNNMMVSLRSARILRDLNAVFLVCIISLLIVSFIFEELIFFIVLYFVCLLVHSLIMFTLWKFIQEVESFFLVPNDHIYMNA